MTLRWAIVGTGRVHATIAPAIRQARGAELAAVCGRDPARTAAFAREHGAARAHDTYDALLNDPGVDVIYIASPNGLHAEQALRAAAAGKHVFCEKPLALSLEDCRRVIAACERARVKLGLGVLYRQHAAHIKARDIVAAGTLGCIELVKSQVELAWRVEQPAWYHDAALAGGGAVYMAGVHRIDLLRFLLGDEVAEVAAFIGDTPPERPFEMSAMTMLRFVGGARGLLHVDLGLPHGRNGIEIHGSAGSAYLIDTDTAWWGGGGGELVVKTDAETVRHEFAKTDLYRAEVEDFVRAIRDDVEPAGTGTDGLRAAEICLAMFESGRVGQTVRLRPLAQRS